MSASKKKENNKNHCPIEFSDTKNEIFNDDILKPEDISLSISSRKIKKKLKAWCGECFQFFEYGPYAKVCQQHVLKGNCNLYECKKKYLNSNESKQCIRKFPNINSENRHMYCVDEEDLKFWDSRLKIQNCIIGGKLLFSDINKGSSIEKYRKNSLDSIKFSDLNLDLPENFESHQIHSNINNNINISSNYLNSSIKFMNFGHAVKTTKISNSKIRENKNIKNLNSVKDYSEKIKIDESNKFDEDFYNKIKTENDKNKMLQISYISSDNFKDLISRIEITNSIDKISDMNKNDIEINNCNNKFKAIKINKNLKRKKILRKIDKKDNKLEDKVFEIDKLEIKSIKNDLLSKQKNLNYQFPFLVNKKENDLNMRKDKIDRENFEINVSISNRNNEINQDKQVNIVNIDGIVNVNGLIDQIGNLKFENSKNDSILEDDILIKQFNKIYFNYNQNKNECDYSNLNDSIFDLNQKIRIDDDFYMLDSENMKLKLNSEKNTSDILIGNLNVSKFDDQPKRNIFFNENNYLNGGFLAKEKENILYSSNQSNNVVRSVFNFNNLNNNINLLGNKNSAKDQLWDTLQFKDKGNFSVISPKKDLNFNIFNFSFSYIEEVKSIKEHQLNEVKFVKTDKFKNETKDQIVKINQSYCDSHKEILISDIIQEIFDNFLFSKNEEMENFAISQKEDKIECFSYTSNLKKENTHDLFFSNEKENKIFNLSILRKENKDNFFLQSHISKNTNRIKKNFKINDDLHIDDIFILINQNMGIPNKYLSKLKELMKKKGIFNARVLRLFKKKKCGWGFLQKEFYKNCSQIEAIALYLEEILEELENQIE